MGPAGVFGVAVVVVVVVVVVFVFVVVVNFVVDDIILYCIVFDHDESVGLTHYEPFFSILLCG